jgi:hypothetical protein
MRVDGIRFAYRGGCYSGLNASRDLEETSVHFDTESGTIAIDLGSAIRMLFLKVRELEVKARTLEAERDSRV